MYHLPTLYGRQNEVCIVDEQKVNECAAECLYKQHACDETVYELCTILMNENNMVAPKRSAEGISLYKSLRTMIKANI